MGTKDFQMPLKGKTDNETEKRNLLNIEEKPGIEKMVSSEWPFEVLPPLTDYRPIHSGNEQILVFHANVPWMQIDREEQQLQQKRQHKKRSSLLSNYFFKVMERALGKAFKVREGAEGREQQRL